MSYQTVVDLFAVFGVGFFSYLVFYKFGSVVMGWFHTAETDVEAMLARIKLLEQEVFHYKVPTPVTPPTTVDHHPV